MPCRWPLGCLTDSNRFEHADLWGQGRLGGIPSSFSLGHLTYDIRLSLLRAAFSAAQDQS